MIFFSRRTPSNVVQRKEQISVGILDRLFGRKQKETTSRGRPPESRRPLPVSQPIGTEGSLSPNDEFYHASRDVLAGYEFFPTLQVRTPMNVLEHFGEVIAGPPSRLPVYCGPEHGCWIPKPRTFRETGIDLPELSEGTAASDVGPVKPSDYVPFLKRFRQIAEADEPVNARIEKLKGLSVESPLFEAFWQTLCRNYPDFPESFFYSTFTRIPGVGQRTAKLLFDSGYVDFDAIRSASDEELASLPGVGSALIKKIRTFVEGYPQLT